MRLSPRLPVFLLCAGLVATVLLAAAYPLPRTAVVEGTVRDGATGEALPGANVRVAGTAIGAATDAEGRFRLADVPSGAQTVEATFVGFEPASVAVDVPEGGRVELDLVLAASTALDEVVVVGGRRGRGMTAPAAPAATPAVPGGTLSARSGAVTAGSAPLSSPAPPSSRAEPGREAGDAVGPERPRPQPGLLTAGDIDDGLNWPSYLGYVRRTVEAQGQSGQRLSLGLDGQAFPDLGLDDRVLLRVVDQAGHPVAGARVTVEATGGDRARRLVTEAGTDGRLALFPRFDFGAGVRSLRLSVSGPGGGGRAESETVSLDRIAGDRTVRVRLPIRVAERAQALDLAFVIDVTGSMSDELRYLTDEFEAIVSRVERRYPGVDLRFGLVAYRDAGDEFVVRRWDFTRSAQEMRQRLAALRADGGGDYPEAMDQALDAALELDWRTGTAARVAFLVADAPPHDDRVEETVAAVRQARARGLRLYPVAASGVADQAEYLMRAAAVLTGARHLFLTDDSGVGLPHAEPKIACYQVTALDNLLVRVIASELEGRRVEPSQDEVIREVGDYDAGVCEPPAVVERPQRRRDGLGYVEAP